MLIFLSTLSLTPTPTADPATTFNSPGTVGFLFVAFMVLGAVLIVVDMVRRVRRVRYRAEIQEKLAAEAAGDGVKGD